MNFFANRLTREYSHWQLLGSEARKLLVSFSLYELVLPLIFVFVNAFLLRQGEGFEMVAIYNLGWFLSTPAGFYLNGYLLRFFSLKKLYWVGAVGQGLVMTSLFFWPVAGWGAVFLFGLAQGLCLGIYWANRNFMSLTETHDEQRGYFTGLEMLFGVVAGVLTPLAIGGILWGWTRFHFSVEQGYQFLGLISVFVLFASGFVMRKIRVKNPQKFHWLGWRVSRNWQLNRIIEVSYGVQNGLSVMLPSLIAFTLIGAEGSLSVLQSSAALIEASVIYIVARKTTIRHRLKLIFSSVALFWFLSLAFAIFFNKLAGIQYLLFLSLATHLAWIARNPITMKIIDDEDEGNPANNYVYVCDRELFLNVGRLIGLGFFFGFLTYFSQATALRFIVLIGAGLQLVVYWAARRVRRS
jgi:MFS transporter, YQGE family, putative transporter